MAKTRSLLPGADDGRSSVAHDRQIRIALRSYLSSRHAGERDTLIIDELGLCQNKARVDIAVINGVMSGFEIKSERDTLNRLPSQCETYAGCFNEMTLVVTSRHLAKARKIVPGWWGILEAEPLEQGVSFKIRRMPRLNRTISAEALVRLLWREEAARLLIASGQPEKDVQRLRRRQIWDRLIALVPTRPLSDFVRETLKSRRNWRVGEESSQNGDSCRSSAT